MCQVKVKEGQVEGRNRRMQYMYYQGAARHASIANEGRAVGKGAPEPALEHRGLTTRCSDQRQSRGQFPEPRQLHTWGKGTLHVTSQLFTQVFSLAPKFASGACSDHFLA